jgi:Leucine-rich repeat (LRR) protein
LDLSYCPNLQRLNCYNNQLTDLNILNNNKISQYDWKNNPIFNNETNTIEKLKEYNRNNYYSEYILK